MIFSIIFFIILYYIYYIIIILIIFFVIIYLFINKYTVHTSIVLFRFKIANNQQAKRIQIKMLYSVLCSL
jgi:hypothetical protein